MLKFKSSDHFFIGTDWSLGLDLASSLKERMSCILGMNKEDYSSLLRHHIFGIPRAEKAFIGKWLWEARNIEQQFWPLIALISTLTTGIRTLVHFRIIWWLIKKYIYTCHDTFQKQTWLNKPVKVLSIYMLTISQIILMHLKVKSCSRPHSPDPFQVEELFSIPSSNRFPP